MAVQCIRGQGDFAVLGAADSREDLPGVVVIVLQTAATAGSPEGMPYEVHLTVTAAEQLAQELRTRAALASIERPKGGR